MSNSIYPPQNYKYAVANNNLYEKNELNNVFDQNTRTELPIDYEEHENTLVISSKDRNLNRYPNQSSYSVSFPEEFKNIYSIELIQSILPNTGNINTHPYLLLTLDELKSNNTIISNDKYMSNAFAILPSTPAVTGFICIDKRVHENVILYFKPSLASLSKMTISITDPYGTLFDFGTDSDPYTKTLQNTFIFKIVTMHKSTNSLAFRNVYK